ncbi:MAG: threonine ammonia-lyase [Vicinamibacteria bacterium]|nr:threonine ammonia-lyase [Vicinamibacteria bacterium]
MITPKDVVAARARIADAIYVSPCACSETLSRLTGSRVFCKLENLQMTGSFKERGALNKLLLLDPEERMRGVVAASAGNHAQAVAYHAARLDIRSTIVMPVGTPLIKVSSTREHGAEVVLHGDGYDDAYEKAVTIASERGSVLVHAFNDEAVMAGQGTIGLELLEQSPQIEAIVIPVGGGGLASGVAVAVKDRRPDILIFGVQTERVPSMKAACDAGAPVMVGAAPTLADGIAVRRTGPLTLPIVSRYLDGLALVSEEELASAVLLLLEREKTVAEGAGAAGLAALLHGRIDLHDRSVALIISGGNIDASLLARIIERGLVKDGRLLRLRIRISDHPGALHRLLGVVSAAQANVMDIVHNRAFSKADIDETTVDLTVETRGAEHIADLERALLDSDYDPGILTASSDDHE